MFVWKWKVPPQHLVIKPLHLLSLQSTAISHHKFNVKTSCIRISKHVWWKCTIPDKENCNLWHLIILFLINSSGIFNNIFDIKPILSLSQGFCLFDHLFFSFNLRVIRSLCFHQLPLFLQIVPNHLYYTYSCSVFI